MNSADLLIFTVYVIVVSYVFYQAYKSLESKVVIVPDLADLNRQMEKYDIKNLIDIKFKFSPSYKLDEFTKIPIVIQNKSQDDTIRIDWDECSITDFDNVTGRAIRLAPGVTDIPQNQAPVIIVPNRKVEENLSDDKAVAAPLFKPAKLRKAVINSKPFRLRLFFTRSTPADPKYKQSYTLTCMFLPKKLSWNRAITIALKPKKPKK
jgi:hypothetical protein